MYVLMSGLRDEALDLQCGRIHKDAEIDAVVFEVDEGDMDLQCGRIHKDAEIRRTSF